MDFIVNLKSGHGLGEKNLKKITAYCDKNNIEYNVHITQESGHATRLAAELVTSGAKTIVAIGGDGTFSEVLNGITSFDNTSLGFIPSGRGNDFAHALGLPLDPIKAFEIIIKGESLALDYIQVGEKRCLNIAGTGLDIDVLKRVAGRPGKFVYLGSLLYCLRHFDPYSIDVTINGETTNYKAIIVGICNGNQYGGGMKLSPNSKIDDGLLDVIIIQLPENGKLLNPLLKFLKGKHLVLPITKVIQCEEVIIRPTDGRPVQMDGEIKENFILDCKIVKGGLKTFKPL
ncbi:MAG: diacylglycerol kinase family lipid kinase [Clostridia bacterium]|nr:diacylglycerol kinase family lipid kinase [Clostridia bacterium]